MRLALRTCEHTFDRLLHLRHMNLLLVAARGKERGLVHEIAEICACKSGSPACEHIKIDIIRNRFSLRMNLQDRLASAYIRLIYHNLTIESAGTQKCRIKNVRAIRRRNDDNPLIGGKAVHLDKQLVEGLFALVMPAAKPCTALASDSINLVDKYNAGRRLLRLLEEVAYTRGADTNEHLDKVGAADREELDPCLAGNRLGKQRFARARGTKEQDALRNACAEFVEFIRHLEELDDFLELLFGFIRARNIGERHLFLIAHHEAYARFSKVHHASAAHLRLLHHEEPKSDEQGNRNK